MKKNHVKTTFLLRNLKYALNLDVHKNEHGGIFNNKTFTDANNVIAHQVVLNNSPYGYLDEDGKLVLVGYSSMFSHMLALYFPEEMGVELKRTEIITYAENKVPVKDLMLPEEDIIAAIDKARENDVPKKDVKRLNHMFKAYNDFEVDIIVYDTKEQAEFASFLV
jgi:hypothetical protein